eukprot:3465852-Alexandrium_andersonii.AAC.1
MNARIERLKQTTNPAFVGKCAACGARRSTYIRCSCIGARLAALASLLYGSVPACWQCKYS